jgi:RNA polymerase sigma-70 factor (ECF subfamily)
VRNDEYDNRDDAALVELTQAGEREAFTPLLLRSYESIVRLCERLLGATYEAQDVAQEAALHAFLGIRNLQEPSRFAAWLHAIAANLARTALRRRRVLLLDSLPNGAPLAVLWAEGLPTPKDAYAAREVHDTIIAALNELSTVNREVVIGFYLEGYSYAELAELLGVPVSSVKGRLFKARQHLRKALQPLAADVLKPDRRMPKERSMPPPDLIEVSVESIYSESWGHRVAVLRAEGYERVLPIRVGPFGADALMMALQGEQFARPMTHDFMAHMLDQTGAQVKRVTLNKLAAEIFAAEVTMIRDGEITHIDARPTDALPLALRCAAPILVERAVYEAESVETPRSLGGQLRMWMPQNYSIATLVDLAISQASVREIEWEGRRMVAVHIGFEGVGDLRPRLFDTERAAWLVIHPTFWEWIVAFAQERQKWYRGEV